MAKLTAWAVSRKCGHAGLLEVGRGERNATGESGEEKGEYAEGICGDGTTRRWCVKGCAPFAYHLMLDWKYLGISCKIFIAKPSVLPPNSVYSSSRIDF